ILLSACGPKRLTTYSTTIDDSKYANCKCIGVGGGGKAPLSLLTGVAPPSTMSWRYCGVMAWPQAGISFRSSYTEMPSLSQRGILLCVFVSVTVWQNSCQRTASQLE